ncbi:GH116 family glycosyl hydrolase [Kribbella swartbergensis]
MTTEPDVQPIDHCCGGDGCCSPTGLDRRRFLALSTIATAGGMLGLRGQAAAAMGVPVDQIGVVPADKGLTAEQLSSLARRGAPTRYSGAALKHIGMPVGGATAGRVYLGGDGRLWLWDVNNPAAAVSSGWVGGTYSDPLEPTSPFRQGFAIRTTSRGRTRTRALDSTGFDDVTFTGPYPHGDVTYADDQLRVDLRVYSPFVPTNLDDSSLPATVLSYTVRNTSKSTVEATLAGWSENPVCLESRREQPTLLRSAAVPNGVQFSAAPGELDPDPQPDILFEDFEGTSYDGWTVEGTAFGPGPVTPESTPEHFRRFGDLKIHGTRFVTSYAFWPGGGYDAPTGKLTSREFTIERGYITAGVGGGHWSGETSVDVVVDGQVVASASGKDMEPLSLRVFDVRRWRGKRARIQIVDANTGGWGHINCDHIVFTDRPPVRPIESFPDHGTFALSTLARRADVVPSLASADTVDAIFDSAAGSGQVDAADGTITGAVRVPLVLRPGESATVDFVVAWYFPVPRDGQFAALDGAADLRHHYATRFGSAAEVVDHVRRNHRRLEAATRRWVETWYDDSTLPHWFLERTFAPASTVATTTCYRFSNGRFYAMEGEYCCEGTCQHVWNYAQSVARIFPELERDVRERVDLGIAFHPDTGAMDYRGEYARNVVAVDGQAGTVLRIFREHQMSADSSFLQRTWPRIKLAIEHLIGRDGTPPNGVLEAEQYNTLDASWYGEIPWITGLYIACLHAGAAMATEMGDTAFATRCTQLAEAGSAYLVSHLWSDEYGYFFHKLDPSHPTSTNSNRGCFADQLYGQTYAHQLGLPAVVPAAKARSALTAVFRNNFVSDHEAFRAGVKIPGGRWYAEQGEAGLLMCTWPFGGDAEAPGGGDPGFVAYLNEVWTGQEYQVAAGLFAEGLVDEALVLTRAVFDRYDATKRNPYNEIECSDHYARAMMSHAVYLAALGYDYHGPLGRLGFAPKLTPDKFQAAFTVAEGWGSYRQIRSGSKQVSLIDLRYGRLRLTTLTFETAAPARAARVRLGRRTVPAELRTDGTKATITLQDPVVLAAGDRLEVSFT